MIGASYRCGGLRRQRQVTAFRLTDASSTVNTVALDKVFGADRLEFGAFSARARKQPLEVTGELR
ncbi:hypothetical protein [Brevundimonas sp. ZS04]|uniref:hypothetical protein n=1 Tax=Brevundimonas sp. ZS04 TaxID=1906854 RepID=UPI00096E1F12|nr:hypothetical protein [Brevundimonas sp. ZS04]OMG52248.1 hypothetical protein BJP32_16695 [Brevundimonas sp. ZS04]